MIVVHHLNHSRSQRVLWLLEELGVPYEIKHYERRVGGFAPEALKEIHPLGKAPIVTDVGPGGEKLVLVESGHIVEYLVDRYDEGLLAPPAASSARLRFRYWLHYAEGSAMPPLLLRLVFGRLDSNAVPLLVRPISRAIAKKVDDHFIGPQIRTHLDFMEGELERSPWFAGEAFSAADIQMSFPLEAARARGGLDKRWPRLVDWLDRIHARPAYERAIGRGGPYGLMA